MIDSMLLAVLTLVATGAPPTASEPVLLNPGPRFEGTLTRTITVQRELQFDSFEASMGGQEIPAEVLPDFEIELEERLELIVTDEALEAGSQLALRRTFEELESSGHAYVAFSGSVDEDVDTVANCALVGRSVRFERSSTEEAFKATLEGDEEGQLPEGLRFDLDLVALLPDQRVSPGDRWKVDAHGLDSLLEPAGPGVIAWSEETAEGEWEHEEDSTGSLTITFEGWVGGHRGSRASLTLDGEFTSVKWRASDLEKVPVAEGPGRETRVDTSAWSGQLVWDVAEGRLRSFDATAELESATTIATLEGGENPQFESTVYLLGKLHLTEVVR
jgi:hypothetical protein